MRTRLTVGLCLLGLAGCDQPQQSGQQRPIKVRSAEQDQLHRLDALNLAIALKRAIYDAGYTCKRVTNAGFVAAYKNLDMWTANCAYDRAAARDWAIFAGPDGSAQVRDCKDVAEAGLPACTISRAPKGSFEGPQ